MKFGERLHQRRTAAGLTQNGWPTAWVSPATTIRQLEHHNRKARRSLMLKLLAVPELNLRVSDIELSAELSAGYRHTPTSWLGPTYDPVGMVTELAETLNGQSGQLEQTLVYIDPQSAKDWMTTCSSPEYGPEYRDSMPLPTMARRIAELVGEHALTVNALGCGDGRTEALLTKYLQHQPSDAEADGTFPARREPLPAKCRVPSLLRVAARHPNVHHSRQLPRSAQNADARQSSSGPVATVRDARRHAAQPQRTSCVTSATR